MSTDFKTGTRVCLDNSSAHFGVVFDDDAKRTEYPGFVPVRWDNGDRTMARAASLIPIDSRSATPQADRGQTAGTPTSPQDVPAPTQLDRIEALLVDIRNLLADQAAPKTMRIVQKGDVVGRIGGKRSSASKHLHFENGTRR
ncbi:hypothetical protein [Arthrobacter sp.]|uniref:hypothetical protein n=1 Tax=Arthrobacter sp. TaxID=1667 RepID=UPI003A94E446